MTQTQLSRGGGGFIIIQDDEEAALALPRSYGIDDIPLALTSVKFDGANVINVADAYGDHLLANGVMNAQAVLPAQLVRFRILNAEVERWYFIGFSDNRPFHVIGSDGGLLNAPVEVTRLKMVPGERYEIVVDLGDDAVGSTLQMRSFGAGQIFGVGGSEPAQTGEFGSVLNNIDFDVLDIVVAEPTADGVLALPATLSAETV